jgi:hypothetical protein
MDESPLSSQREVLEGLLDEELTFDATTTSGLTNHLPMALVAKCGLGASSEELRRFATRYEKRLAPRIVVDAPLTKATWRSAIGRRGTFDALSMYFVKAVNDEGPEATLRQHLDALTPGICGAAFHGAIRLAYALELSSPSRIAAGLAYLAENAEPLGDPLRSRSPEHGVSEVFARLSTTVDSVVFPDRKLISEEMLDAASWTTLRDAVATCRLDDNTIDELRRAALTLYATTGDFTSLHAVTGVDALTALRPYAQDITAFDAACVMGVAAAYATVGAPPMATLAQLAEFTEASSASIDEIAAVGANSDDEHVAKLIYTSLRLRERTSDDLYLAVAARKAGLSRATRTE